MDLRYVVMTIIKIVISVPTLLLLQNNGVYGAALMGGHLDNKTNQTNITSFSSDLSQSPVNITAVKNGDSNSEEIPDPSPLVLPGYNLPEMIFNKGKPFYLEKDPLTGKIDFENRGSEKLDDLYDYVNDEPSDDIYDKSNIDRKDGPIDSHHRPSDVNQLTPNFHDFLNLPVKYNSNKYVYPLISSSYANTKIQGNVNKYHNHKDYSSKITTKKPTTYSPTYYTTKSSFFNPDSRTTRRTTTTSTSPPTTAKKIVNSISITTKPPINLYNNGMSNPFNEEFDEYYDVTEKVKPNNEIYLTTENVNNIYLTTKSPITTTKKTMSLFEQLFGDYDETVSTTEKTKPPSMFANLPKKTSTEKPVNSTSIYAHYPNSHAGPNILSGSNMGVDAYEYEEYEEQQSETSTSKTTTKKPTITSEKAITSSITTTTSQATKTTTTTTISPLTVEGLDQHNFEEDYEYDNDDKPSSVSTSSSTTSHVTTTIPTTKATSLPLGENHIVGINNRDPIIVATHNLREKLNEEKVNIHSSFSGYDKPLQHVPSTSNIHIAPDQDMVSFVVGHHQNVDSGGYIGSAIKENPYQEPPKPSYLNIPEESIQAVTIHPLKNPETSLSIGVPVNVQRIPGQVVDEDVKIDQVTFPKGTGQKIVFPEDKSETVPLQPPLPNREVLKLNSKPMYHQLPSDLTPPKEKEGPSRIDRPRPPWDPRPGHFYSGKPEYNRPPRPIPEVAYKRIDNLPNILPQFRPNMKHHNHVHYFDRLNRQPLLERPSNRPIGFFEKLQPPPPPPGYHHHLRKIPGLAPQQQNLDERPIMAEDRIINEGMGKKVPEFGFYNTPPLVLANRRHSDDDTEVETLQMIQAKHDKKDPVITALEPSKVIEAQSQIIVNERSTEKPLYVVYPVNTPPIKMDVIDSNKKESVVIGTRAELPLPPSKINKDFNYHNTDRNDAPILKPHTRPAYPTKSDFPYPLERPDATIILPAVPEAPSNNLDANLVLGNQWNSLDDVESRIVTGNKQNSPNQISVTLKTFTEKPIAVAYTPTEPSSHQEFYDRFSLPNYASPVIPEIRLGTVENADPKKDEFTVSAVMHTHPQLKPVEDNMRHDSEDFQAPFQASVNIDSSLNQGWAVIRDKNKTTVEHVESTTIPLATTSEFDIENFKPQLEGGFKPIYNFPDDGKTADDLSDRAE